MTPERYKGTMINLQCRWWIYPACNNKATHLILMCCNQGHIREKLLCDPHISTTKANITQNTLYCDCGKPIQKSMVKHPIEDHWNLSGPLSDTEPITTTYGPAEHRDTVQKIRQVPFDQLQKYMTPQATPYKPTP